MGDTRVEDPAAPTPETVATPCPDGKPFDPEPWLTSSMAASAQRRWSQTRFAPRAAYCQDEGHYPDTIYRPPATSPGRP